MVDKLADEAINNRQKFSSTILPAIILGITTSIRVLGPLAGLLVLAYAVWKIWQEVHGLHSSFGCFTESSPYLPCSSPGRFSGKIPLHDFIEVFRFMSDNPTNLSVLFGGEVYRAVNCRVAICLLCWPPPSRNRSGYYSFWYLCWILEIA